MISEKIIADARDSSLQCSILPETARRDILVSLALALEADTAAILAANKQDCTRAQEENLPPPLLKRLHCGKGKIQKMAEMLRSIAGLEKIVGRTLLQRELDKTLVLSKISCPIGVLGFIFESRPDAFIQMAGLCIKTANALIAKGGREAYRTNSVLFAALQRVLREAELPVSLVHLMEGREDVRQLLRSDNIDMIIPRGSNTFVRQIMEASTCPVLGHADGICHLYIDKDADSDMALRVLVDAKTQYAAVCNAVETLLLHADIAQDLLPRIHAALSKYPVELRGCEHSRALVPAIIPAADEDWSTEYLDYCLSVRIVNSCAEAIEHINRYGSKHTDSIITANDAAAAQFIALVDSASVMRNCSTRFADGFCYGLGAESGISTGKLHARGPVGPEGLCTYKWVLEGEGHIIADYHGTRNFTHKNIPVNNE